MKEKDVNLIVAMTRGRVIGKNGGMPWKLPSDLRRFQKLTMGHPIIMGYNTFVSILGVNGGKPLAGRTNIVVTENHAAEVRHLNGEPATLPRTALSLALSRGTPFIIGGAKIYEKLLPQTTKLYLTLVDGEIPGDTYFPEEFRMDEWEVDGKSYIPPRRHDPADSHDTSFQILTR